MKDRAGKNPNYLHVKICAKWEKFEGFLEDMGERPEGHTLDRIDNDGDYCPENCRWASERQQYLNKRRTIWVRVGGEKFCLKDACEKIGRSYSMVAQRIRKLGWEPQRALDTPKLQEWDRHPQP